MNVSIDYGEKVISFVVEFDDNDLTLDEEQENKKIKLWSKMLDNSLSIVGGVYPIYEFESGLLYLYGWVDGLKSKEFENSFEYITSLLKQAKDTKFLNLI